MTSDLEAHQLGGHTGELSEFWPFGPSVARIDVFFSCSVLRVAKVAYCPRRTNNQMWRGFGARKNSVLGTFAPPAPLETNGAARRGRQSRVADEWLAVITRSPVSTRCRTIGRSGLHLYPRFTVPTRDGQRAASPGPSKDPRGPQANEDSGSRSLAFPARHIGILTTSSLTSHLYCANRPATHGSRPAGARVAAAHEFPEWREGGHRPGTGWPTFREEGGHARDAPAHSGSREPANRVRHDAD